MIEMNCATSLPSNVLARSSAITEPLVTPGLSLSAMTKW